MKPIGLYLFVLGIMILGFCWIAFKPSYDLIATIAVTNSTYGTPITPVTSEETAFFSIFPFLIGGLILVWMVIKLTRKGGSGGQE